MTKWDFAAMISVFYLAFEIGFLRARVRTLETLLSKEPKQ